MTNEEYAKNKILDVLELNWTDLTPQQRYVIEDELSVLADYTRQDCYKEFYNEGYQQCLHDNGQ